MKNFWKRAFVLGIAAVLALSCMACGRNKGGKKYDSEKDALIFSTLETEGIYSPFYSTAGTDSTITGNTQISMLTADKDGNVAYGEDEPVVTLDMATQFKDASGAVTVDSTKAKSTTYQFVLKKGIKFSDGVELTYKDVLFNLYLYLDPVYMGSSTIYSTKIEGLTEYRSLGLSSDENEESALDTTANEYYKARLENLQYYLTDKSYVFEGEELAQIEEDIETLSEYFEDDIKVDWSSAKENLETYEKEYDVSEAWQVYLLTEGLIMVKTNAQGRPMKNDDGKYLIDYKGFDAILGKNPSEEACLQAVRNYYIPSDGITAGESANFASLLNWVCGSKLKNDMQAQSKSQAIADIKANNDYPRTIRGIKVVDGDAFFGEKNYSEDYKVLQITIKDVDPKAIWNFGFTVAPLHYYSGTYNNIDYVQAFSETPGSECYGFPLGDAEFFTKVVQAKNKVPMGAGVYRASTRNGTPSGNVLYGGDGYRTLDDGFSKDGFIFFERNDYFYTTMKKSSQTDEEAKKDYNAKIRYVQYKTVDSKSVMNSLISGQIFFGDPNAKEDNLRLINEQSHLSYQTVTTAGYGYIGINAAKVNNINVRRAIMSVLDASLIKSYYPGNLAQLIDRPMSLVSWVYDNKDGSKWNPGPYYSYNSAKDSQGNYVLPQAYKDYCTAAKIQTDANGKKYYIENGTKKYLKYTFTVAGGSDDHPAYMTLETAMRVLNQDGWDINIKTDSRALSVLATGGLTVWCAAWSSTIDPDMYQVYHMNSQASSTLAWGYDWIKANPSTEDYKIIKDLSTLIEEGRKTLDRESRTTTYRRALNKVMELAVEFPLYQRNDLYVYNNQIIDGNTLIPESECTAYQSPISRIWEIDYIH